MNIEKRCNHYTLIVACMLSGASQDRPVIVGWSTAPRGQVIQESLGQVPKKLAAGPRVLARTESSRTQSGTRPGGPPHDHWAKLGQLRYTRSQYAFVVMHFSRWNSSRRPSRKKGEPVRSNGVIAGWFRSDGVRDRASGVGQGHGGGVERGFVGGNGFDAGQPLSKYSFEPIQCCVS